jgi:hypothetical protein
LSNAVLQWILHIWRKHTCQQSCESSRYKCFLHQELHNSWLISNSIYKNSPVQNTIDSSNKIARSTFSFLSVSFAHQTPNNELTSTKKPPIKWAISTSCQEAPKFPVQPTHENYASSVQYWTSQGCIGKKTVNCQILESFYQGKTQFPSITSLALKTCIHQIYMIPVCTKAIRDKYASDMLKYNLKTLTLLYIHCRFLLFLFSELVFDTDWSWYIWSSLMYLSP